MRVGKDLNIVFVGLGDTGQTEAYRQRARSPHLFIADPEAELYQAFGLGRATAKQIFTPKVFARGFGAILRGHWAGASIGDPWQMPGVFLIETDGSVSWEYRSVDASDNPKPQAILSRLESADPKA